MGIDGGDTVWVMISAALVMLMTPGLGLFYAGLARRKNVLSLLMQCFIAIALVSVVWALWGYSLAFGPSGGGLIGGWNGSRLAKWAASRTPATPQQYPTQPTCCSS